MIREIPIDMKTLIDAARGRRNLKSFAKDAGISYSKLYRISEHKVKRMIDDDTLKAIADHAEEGSGVTLEALKKACNFVIDMNMTWEDEQKRLAKRRGVAESAILKEVSLNSGVSMERILHPKLAQPGLRCFDLGLKVCRTISSNTEEQHLFFKICDTDLTSFSVDELNRFTGVVLNFADPKPNERYYLVVLNDRDPDMVTRLDVLRKSREYFTRISNGLFMSILIVTIDEDGFSHLSEIVIGRDERVICMDGDIENDPRFDTETDEDNMYVHPWLDVGRYVASKQTDDADISEKEKRIINPK